MTRALPFMPAFTALRNDLLAEGGPRISTMRNYRFAILVYDPKQELNLRQQIRSLSDDLHRQGWHVLAISLYRLLLNRLRAEEPRVLESIAQLERRLYARDPTRALNHLKEKLARYVESPEGMSADVIAEIEQFATQYPDEANRTLIFLTRAGSLYPFFRSSALLKHLDGKTQNLPVVLLYPGQRQGETGLSFMGKLNSDRDYRPRIYS